MRRRRDTDPGPVAIDPKSGFKVPWGNLVREYTGDMVDYRFADKQNPQDFVRGRADKVTLPYYRPEPADRGISNPIEWENFALLELERGGYILMGTEGVVITGADL